MKNDAYQGKQKVKDRWSETEYVVVRQVTDGIPAYEVKDEAGNVKTIHHNRLFLVAAPKEAITPLGAGVSISEENIVRSTHAEHTLLEVENDSPEGFMDGADTLSPTSRVPLGWVGGVLQPLPLVAPRPTMWTGIGAGDGAESEQRGSPLDLPVEPPNLACIFQIPDIIRGWGHNGSNGNLHPGTMSMGKTTPPMMIPGRNLKEVLDLPAHP